MKSSHAPNVTSTGQASWTRDLARDLFCGGTTPFAWTLLRSPAEAALRSAYAELGSAAISPGEPFWRLDGGLVRLNAALVAEMDQSLAGATWLGRVQPQAPGGLLARLQAGSTAKRCQARIAAAADDLLALQALSSRWLTFVQGLRWTQADLLQVMEELEPHALAALRAYFLARMGLNAAHASVQTQLAEWAPDCPPDIRASLYLGVEGLPSVIAAEAVNDAARRTVADPERESTLARYGYRGPGEARPDGWRWGAAPELLVHLARQRDAGWRPEGASDRRKSALAELKNQMDGGRFRHVEALLQQVHASMRAADIAWDVLARVMAAAQHWAAAAAGEAIAAGLVAQPGDVLYLELEELKQVATGEWHEGRSAGVVEAVEARKQAQTAASPSSSEGQQMMVCPGECDGPRYCDSPWQTLPPSRAVWLGESPDPGCAPFWRDACGVLSTGDDIWAPGMIVARGLGVPARVGVAGS